MNRAQRRLHRRAWLVLAVLLPLIALLALALRSHHARVLAPELARRAP